jgi:hypothetical protein
MRTRFALYQVNSSFRYYWHIAHRYPGRRKNYLPGCRFLQSGGRSPQPFHYIGLLFGFLFGLKPSFSQTAYLPVQKPSYCRDFWK